MLGQLIAGTASAIEIAGVGAMVLGFVVAAALALREFRRRPAADVYRGARQRIGKSILLGLELLVAADILRTVSKVPSLNQVAVLAGIVGIRTFLSFTLEIELTGRAPWQQAKRDAGSGGRT